MRWAIVGLGTFGVGQVIPGFADARQSRMTAFVSGNPAKARDLGARYGVSHFYDYQNFDDIAQNEEIDCVYIVLPVGLHAEFTIRALRAGKHVLCEKPMASTAAEAQAMVDAARAANRQLGVAYRVHFEPNNRDTQRRIAAGELGTMRFISADHGFSANPDYPPHKWRLEKLLGGGGSMYDIGFMASTLR
jgi:predicted dehydrogenase